MAASAERPTIFLDTSVLFAAVLSARGGSRALLKLGEQGLVRLVVSPRVIDEANRVLQRKAPREITAFALLLDLAGVEVGETAASGTVKKLQTVVGHPGDAQVVADAVLANVDFLATLDKTHLLGNAALTESTPFRLGSPGDCLEWFRERVMGNGQGES